MKCNKRPSLTLIAAALALSCAAGAAQADVTIKINNLNAAGVGFNDPTPATPVGGNTGTTLGEQRLIAFTYAANIWGKTLSSKTPIVINAQFRPLSCTATGATLGSAGATQIFADFKGAIKPGTLYSYALANKLYGGEISDTPGAQINANFNSNLGKPGCLTNTYFYLGLDSNHGANIDFVTVLLHEMGHGVGFQTFTNGATGAQLAGYPSVWDHFLLDNTTNKTWVEMNNAERVASSLKPGGLSWTGAKVTQAVPKVLGAPEMRVTGAGAGAAGGMYAVADAQFGPRLTNAGVTGQVMPVALQSDSAGVACTPLNAANAAAVKNSIALVSRGTCAFTIKVKNAQNAGAIAVIVSDNAPGALAELGGADGSITIPSVRISQADGALLAASLTKLNGNTSGTVASLGMSKTVLPGTDAAGRITMYTPAVYQPGSSVSHYNTAAKRNQLMEPAINPDLTQANSAPNDLTLELLKDIGW